MEDLNGFDLFAVGLALLITLGGLWMLFKGMLAFGQKK